MLRVVDGTYSNDVLLRTRMEAVADYLVDRYPDPISMTDVARSVSLSPFYFTRVFKAHVGIPPHRFLTLVRMDRAANLLLDTNLSVTQICSRVGFSSLSHFITTFRRHFNAPPLEYRRRAHELAATMAGISNPEAEIRNPHDSDPPVRRGKTPFREESKWDASYLGQRWRC